MKHQFYGRKANIPTKSQYHYSAYLKSLVLAYQAKIYYTKFELEKQEIAERLGVRIQKVYELLRKFGDA